MRTILKQKTIGLLTFNELFSNEQIEAKIKKLAQDLTVVYQDKQPLVISILNGGFMFTASLCKQLNIPVLNMSFIKLTLYDGMQAQESVSTVIGLHEDLNNRDILILDDIIDTGRSLFFLVNYIQQMSKPSSIKIATLLDKPNARIKNIQTDYACFKITNDFVVGYGLDYNGVGRNWNAIYQLSPPKNKK